MTWWKQAVCYEIYIRSFQDSDGDGIGDLNGITARLDYLADDLGVDAIWITPFYPSPQIDFGYDVADYENVDSQYGTLADVDRLVTEAHRRGIRVIIDIVLNHTSDRHPWFASSRSSRSSPYRDWYIWRDGRAPHEPPNNWQSAFGGSAWTFDEQTGQWYYHFFYRQQPDLNWRNAAVEARMFQTLEFWLARGVDGFRLDAVNTLFEDAALRDNPPLPQPVITLTGVRSQDFVRTRGLPEVHDVLTRLRTFVNRRAPAAVLISEAYVETVGDLVRFYGGGREMQLPFNFFLAQVPALDAAAFRRAVDEVDRACGAEWPSLVLSNHDIDRACDRYAEDTDDPDAIAKLLATMLLTLRGTPFMYYGEELAMRTIPPASLRDVRDPVGRTFWPRYKGRDGVRRPMPWTGDPGVGFTTGTPWLDPAPPAQHRSVADQHTRTASVLSYYRTLLAARRRSPALRGGSYAAVASSADVFAYMRHDQAETVLIVLNMARAPRAVGVPVGALPARWRVVLGTHRTGGTPVTLTRLTLEPLEAAVLIPLGDTLDM